ncbi:MAG: T9SS type A sorting domain-containing protein [Crocinitomicaceae bacterium]
MGNSIRKNNDYFLVDYSEDGTTWKEVGRIDGNGSTTIEQKYSFNHRQQSNTTTYYRLTQVDFDGTREILRTISANCINKDEIVVSPNPTNGQFSVYNVQKGAIVSVFSALGTQLSSTVVETNFANFDLSNHPAGVYFINVQSENNLKTLKVTLK